MRNIRLIGGAADGMIWQLPDEFMPPDYFRVYVHAPLSAEGYDPNVAAPSTIEAHEHLYQLHSIHLDKDRVVLYGAPQNHSKDDALIALFGPPVYW